MPNPLFPGGIPISQLNDAARRIAEQLDESPLVHRSDLSERADGKLSRAEVRAGLAAIDNFSPEDQAALKQMAQILGVSKNAPDQPVAKEWLDRDPPPKGLFEARTAVSIGDFVYVQDDTHNMRTSGLLRYDIKNDQWSEQALPDGFSRNVSNTTDGWRHTSFAAAGDQLYMVGGAASGRHMKWAYRFDPGQKQWHRIANVNPRSSIALAGADDGKLYAFGGTAKIDDPNDPGRPADGGMSSFMNALGGNAPAARRIKKKINAPTNIAQVYDPGANTWTDLPALPVNRREAKAISVGGKLFVIGGRGDGGKRLNRVDVFDPTTGQWQDPPFRMPTALQNPCVWVEGGEIHVTGGETRSTASRPGCNTVHEIMNPASGEVHDGDTLRAPDDATNIQVIEAEGRLFAMGGTGYSRKNDTFCYEWGAKEPDPAQGDNVITIINNNTTVVNDIDITTVIKNITNVVNVTHIDNSRTNLHIHNTTINNTNVDIDISVLALMTGRRQCGFFDPDQSFFLRTKAGDQDLIQCGVDGDGHRQIVGKAKGDMGPAPGGRKDLFLFHEASGTMLPISTDPKGQFAVELPDDVRGEVMVFSYGRGKVSGAATLQVP